MGDHDRLETAIIIAWSAHSSSRTLHSRHLTDRMGGPLPIPQAMWRAEAEAKARALWAEPGPECVDCPLVPRYPDACSEWDGAVTRVVRRCPESMNVP